METNDNTISEIQDNNISEKSEINYTDFIGTWHNDADHQSYMYIQNVNGKHIYIEIEEKCCFIDKHYNSIQEMKNVIELYRIARIDAETIPFSNGKGIFYYRGTKEIYSDRKNWK